MILQLANREATVCDSCPLASAILTTWWITQHNNSVQNNSWPLAIFQTNFSKWPIKFDFGWPRFVYISINALKYGANVYKNGQPILKPYIVLCNNKPCLECTTQL